MSLARQIRVPGWIAWTYSVAVIIILLAPFDFYAPVRREPNGARWSTKAHGIDLASNAIISSDSAATKLHESFLSAPGLTLETWIATADLEQNGPARIVTYSLDKALRNFTLGQEDDALVLRLRTTKTDLNGKRPHAVIGDVFTGRDPMHLVVTCDHVTTRVFADGILRGQLPAAGGTFDNWNAGYRFALGNELTGNRSWQGSIYLVAVYRRALSADEIRRHSTVPPFETGKLVSRAPASEGLVALYTFDAGTGSVVHDRSGTADPLDLTIPEYVVTSREPFLHPPYRYLDLRFLTLKQVAEIVFNVGLFVPLGFLFFAGARWSLEKPFAAALVIVLGGLALSLGAEIAQYFIRGRESSWGDVLHNGLGTAVGVIFSAILQRCCTPRLRNSGNSSRS